MNIRSQLDQFVPTAAIEQAVVSLLNEAGWQLEFDGRIVAIPKTPPPVLISRAFIAAHSPEVFLGDHFEAVVALHPELVANTTTARAGYLKLYFNLQGKFVSEDRFPPKSA